MDPRQIISSSPMRPKQFIALGICILLNALDGFDVLAISFASPGIAKEWGIERAALGIVLSMELIGMAVGSIVLGSLADRIGRRPVVIGSLVVMMIGMFAAAIADSVITLSILRLCTGLGIGGMLAAINAVAAESSNLRNRNLAVSIMAAGYPIGVVLGGTIASMLLTQFDWRSVFVTGGAAALILLPATIAFVPESIDFLINRRAPDALVRINTTLKRFGYSGVETLPEGGRVISRLAIARLFEKDLALPTLLLLIGYFANIMTFYFALKWTPKIVADMGFAPSTAAQVLVWTSVGGFIGSTVFSALTRYFGLRPLLFVSGILAGIAVAVYGQSPPDIQILSILSACAGFMTNAVVVGSYALMAEIFPVNLRAGGTGFIIGVGRGGAAMGPIIAGFLFAGGWSLAGVALAMASGSIIAAIAFVAVQPVSEPIEQGTKDPKI